jgi:hypothetical protein
MISFDSLHNFSQIFYDFTKRWVQNLFAHGQKSFVIGQKNYINF